MRKNILIYLTCIFTLFSMSTLLVFASDRTVENMTSTEFLEKSDSNGVIILNEDVILSNALQINGGYYLIDLNDHTLTLTKDSNLFTNDAIVTFKNGTLKLDQIKGNADCILGVGNYGSRSTLTLDNIILQANNYKSPYALIYVYNDSTLNIKNNSVINAKNEKSLSGGVIKTSAGQSGKINILNSTLNFQNAGRGFVDGTINIKDSNINMKGLSNGINTSPKGLDLTLDHSNLTISGTLGRAITVDGTNIKIKNHSNLYLSHSGEADIRFKNTGTIQLDQSSDLTFKTIKLDEPIKEIDLKDLILSEKYDYQLDNNGNIIKIEKVQQPDNGNNMPETGDLTNLSMIAMMIFSITGLVYLRYTEHKKKNI